MKFEQDVFISYAHLDDKPIDEGAKGWITEFHSLLETRLEQTIGRDINIWRDERLTGNEVFTPEIESHIPKLKLMVSIITPRYIESDWCKKELDAFYQAASYTGGVNIGNKSRIFKIIKTPVDREKIELLPEKLHRLFDEILDYKFYIQDPGTGKFRELRRGNWVDNKIQQEYMDKLEDVVQDMANLIKKINSTEINTTEKRKIYLAETTYDLQSYRDNLARELQEGGFIVLPNMNLPNFINNFIADVEKYIDQSVLSVHLISNTNYAAQPEGSEKSIVIIQNEIAANKSETNNLSRLIWLPPAGVNSTTNQKMIDHQKTFVDDLRTNHSFQRGADILEGPLEELKQAIFDTINRLDAEEKAKQDALREEEEKAKRLAATTTAGAATVADGTVPTIENNGVRLVYLVCDQRDLDETRPLEDLIADSGNEVLLPLFEGDQAQLRQAHLDNLKICDSVIIYYGAGNYRWAGSMKSDLLRLPALGRTKPLSEKAIYIAGPADKDKETFKAIGFEMINGLNGFTSDLFKNFFK
ncbi:MAG: TIR domain-containing protein [Ferruginibacter sp.]